MATMIDGPAGPLEIRPESPKTEPRALCVVGHPHPLFGGTMDNKVAYTLARSALNLGCAALRFNFRGVGRSAGRHDKGQGEIEDFAAVVQHGRAQHPDLPLILSGFSFGAFISLMLAGRDCPAALVTIAPPLNHVEASELPRPDCPWLLLHGDADDVVDPEISLERARALQPPPTIEIVPGAGHFFHGGIVDLGRRIERWLGPVLAEL